MISSRTTQSANMRQQWEKSNPPQLFQWTRWTLYFFVLSVPVFTNCGHSFVSVSSDLDNFDSRPSGSSSLQLNMSSLSPHEDKDNFLSTNVSDGFVLESEVTPDSRVRQSSESGLLEAPPVSDGYLQAGSQVSCEGRCGDRESFPCSCTDICIVNGNCCHDMKELCSALFVSGTARFKHLRGAEVECSSLTSTFMIISCLSNVSARAEEILTENFTVQHEIRAESNSFNEVSQGKESYYDGNSMSKSNYSNAFLSLILDAPVTDRSTGLIYRNLAVARCHGVLESDALRWAVEAKIVGSQMKLVDIASVNEQVSTEGFAYKPSSSLKRLTSSKGSECITHSKRECKLEWLTHQPDLERMCLDGAVTYHETLISLAKVIFDNIHCLHCSVGSYNQSKPVVASSYPTDVDKNFKLSLLASLTSSGDLSVRAAAGEELLSWAALDCSLASAGPGRGMCSKRRCGDNFERRPDGECRKLQKLVFATNGGDCALLRSEEAERMLISMIQCYLETFKSTEVVMKTVRFDTVFDNRLNRSLVQLSALIYSPITYWSGHVERLLRDLLMLIYNAHFCCEPHPPTKACWSPRCGHDDSTIPSVKTMDFYRNRNLDRLEKLDSWEPASNVTLISCGAVLSLDYMTQVLRCLQEPVYVQPRLSFYELAAGAACFGNLEGKEDLYRQPRQPCNNTDSIGRGEMLFLFIMFVVKFVMTRQGRLSGGFL